MPNFRVPQSLVFKVWEDRDRKLWLITAIFKTHQNVQVDGREVRQEYVDIKCIDGRGGYCESTLTVKEYEDLQPLQWNFKDSSRVENI